MAIYSNIKTSANIALFYSLVFMESDDDYPYDFMNSSQDMDAQKEIDRNLQKMHEFSSNVHLFNHDYVVLKRFDDPDNFTHNLYHKQLLLKNNDKIMHKSNKSLFSQWDNQYAFDSLELEAPELSKDKKEDGILDFKDLKEDKNKNQEDAIMNPDISSKEDIFDHKPQYFKSTYHKSESNISVVDKYSKLERSTPMSREKELNESHVKFTIEEGVKSNPKHNKISSRSLMTPKLSKEDVLSFTSNSLYLK